MILVKNSKYLSSLKLTCEQWFLQAGRYATKGMLKETMVRKKKKVLLPSLTPLIHNFK